VYLNNKILLSNDTVKGTNWYLAADLEKIEILKKIWEWAEERLTTEEKKEELLLATDDTE
jgi:hypothetical protein